MEGCKQKHHRRVHNYAETGLCPIENYRSLECRKVKDSRTLVGKSLWSVEMSPNFCPHVPVAELIDLCPDSTGPVVPKFLPISSDTLSALGIFDLKLETENCEASCPLDSLPVQEDSPPLVQVEVNPQILKKSCYENDASDYLAAKEVREFVLWGLVCFQSLSAVTGVKSRWGEPGLEILCMFKLLFEKILGESFGGVEGKTVRVSNRQN